MEHSVLRTYELQEQIRAKDAKLIELSSANKKLEYEAKQLGSKLREKEYELSRIIEDNQRLTSRVKSLLEITQNGKLKDANDYIRDLLKKNEEIKKLHDRMQSIKAESAQKLDFEVRRLSKLVAEGDRKLQHARSEYEKVVKQQKDSSEYIHIIEQLRQENASLQFNRHEDAHVAELELQIEQLYQENIELKERPPTQTHEDLWKVIFDVHKIQTEVKKLMDVCKSLQTRNGFSMKILLGSEETECINSRAQLNADLVSVKNDLNSIKSIISDFYAEQCGGQICNQQ